MAGSPLALRKWAYAIYLDATSLKGVSSMKLHRDIGVTQKTAWFMQQRIREAFAHVGPVVFAGPVEVDETYIGGLERNKHESKKLKAGRGPIGKTAVVGMKDRGTKRVAAKVIERTDRETLQGFVDDHAAPGAQVYTDGTSPYKGMDRPHESVKHSVGEYVRGLAHTNGVESFWSMLKRAHKGTFHKLSTKHLQRYGNEFAGRQNIRDMDTIDQMAHIVAQLVGKRLMYRELIAWRDRFPDPLRVALRRAHSAHEHRHERAPSREGRDEGQTEDAGQPRPPVRKIRGGFRRARRRTDQAGGGIVGRASHGCCGRAGCPLGRGFLRPDGHDDAGCTGVAM